MLWDERKTIGVFIFQPVKEFQKKLCQGITDEGKKQGYNILFFTAFGDYAHNARFVEGERQMIDLPPYEQLDGVILVLDTIDIRGMKSKLIKRVKERCHCPVVCVREEVSGFHNVLIDNESSMESIFRHFIDEHELEKICFMTGTKGHEDAEERLQSFLNAMEAQGIPVTEQQIFYGDFWKYRGKEACDHFLANGYVPQAIICANDYMAVAVISELIERGYRIPEDICVSGYDGIREAYAFQPSITTVCVPFYDMGVEAVEVIARNLSKQGNPEKIYFPTRLVPAESCGCMTMSKAELIRNRRNNHEEIENERARQLEATFMSVNLEEVKDLDGLSGVLSSYIKNVEGYRDYFICLCEGIGDYGEPIQKLKTYTENMHLHIGFSNQKRLRGKERIFKRENLLPEELLRDEPKVYYFTPLHYKNQCFGYEAVSFLDSSNAGNLFLSWVVNVENAIQDIIVQNEMNRLIEELEHMYIRDVLTGIYNRRGFEKYSDEKWKTAIEKKKTLFVIQLDMDGLKFINDNFGHAEGDEALKVIADALIYACKGTEICARMGGDEFAVCDLKSEAEAKEFCARFDKYLIDYNKENQKDYPVYASYGIYLDIPATDFSIEACLKESDGKMYKNKMRNKRDRGLD